MEGRYAGGYFLAVDLAQRVILSMRDAPATQHVLQYERNTKPSRSGLPAGLFQWLTNGICQDARDGTCFATNRNADAILQPAMPGQDAGGGAGRLARDVARYLVLYVKRHPHMVHAFYAHECHEEKHRRTAVREKCIGCNWRPKEWLRCDYCQMGACTTCVSESSYKPCGQGCCRLCVSCYPLIANETCDVPGCTQLRCGRQQAQRCEDNRCWKRLCMMHSQKGKHECENQQDSVE